MEIIEIFFYYFLTSGLFVALSLFILDLISQRYNLVNFLLLLVLDFLINLMQFNVVNNTNPSFNRGFLIHTFWNTYGYY